MIAVCCWFFLDTADYDHNKEEEQKQGSQQKVVEGGGGGKYNK